MAYQLVLPTVVGVIVSIFIIIGSTLFGVLPGVVDQKIKDGLVITNNSDAFDRFLNPPANVTLRVYFFNVTNPDEVKQKKKPILVEIGPYVYKEQIVKENVVFINNGSTVKYDQKEVYIFDRKSSIGDDTDIIRTINLPLTLLPRPCRMNPICAVIFSTLMEDLYSTQITREYQVKDLIFGTYDVLKEGSALKALLPSFAFVMNDTTKDNNYEVGTGKDNISDLNRVTSYNGNKELSFWKDKYCNAINGTEGSEFPPHIDKNKKLYIFVSDICRSVYFEYERSSKVKDIPGYHFAIHKDVFESPKDEPNNMCFCTQEQSGICALKRGVLDLSSCKKEAPVFISAPHFLYGDKSYIDAVEGLEPEKKKHESTIDVQKITGSVLKVSKKIQINVNVEPVKDYEKLVNMSIVFPVLWLNENGVISDNAASDFKSKVLTQITITQVVPPVILSLGLLLLLVSVSLFIFLNIRRKYYEYMS